jgi:hypothetical protein
VCPSPGDFSRIHPELYKTLSADANIIQVELDCSGTKCDQDHFHTVGLPDAAVRESRVRAALKICGYDIPPTHISINLAPADIKKESEERRFWKRSAGSIFSLAKRTSDIPAGSQVPLLRESRFPSSRP